MNPKIKDFLEQYKEITIVSFAWALFWRLYLVIIGIALMAGVFVAILEN